MTTYSFKDVVGAFNHPTAGSFVFAGQIGAGQFTITNATERTSHDVASDGNVMVSYVAGDNGSMTIEVQQTSPLHQFLLNWYNQIKTAADNQDVSGWAAAAITLRSILDNSLHVLTGVSPQKVPDKTYAGQGGRLTWVLMAANVISQ